MLLSQGAQSIAHILSHFSLPHAREVKDSNGQSLGKNTVYEVHLGWTRTRPNHPSLNGRELIRHIPRNTWLLGRHHSLNAWETPLPTPWDKMAGEVPGPPSSVRYWRLTGGPTSPWSCVASWLSAESSACGWHFVGLCFWSSPKAFVEFAGRAGSVPHYMGPLRVLDTFRIWLRKVPWTGSPVALAMGGSLQCCYT